jgi:hypothetical protein
VSAHALLFNPFNPCKFELPYLPNAQHSAATIFPLIALPLGRLMLESWAGTAAVFKCFSRNLDGTQFVLRWYGSLLDGECSGAARAEAIQRQELFMRACAAVWMRVATQACVCTMPKSSNLHSHCQGHRADTGMADDIKKTQEQTSEGTFAPLHAIPADQIQCLTSYCRRMYDHLQPFKAKHKKGRGRSQGKTERALFDQLASYHPLPVVLPHDLKGRLASSVKTALAPFQDATTAEVWGVKLLRREAPVSACILVPVCATEDEVDKVFELATRARHLALLWNGDHPWRYVDSQDDAWVIASLLLVDAAADPHALLDALPEGAMAKDTLDMATVAQSSSFGHEWATWLLEEGFTGTPKFDGRVTPTLLSHVVKKLADNRERLGLIPEVVAILNSACSANPLRAHQLSSAAATTYRAMTVEGTRELTALTREAVAQAGAAAQQHAGPKRGAAPMRQTPVQKRMRSTLTGRCAAELNEQASDGEGHDGEPADMSATSGSEPDSNCDYNSSGAGDSSD